MIEQIAAKFDVDMCAVRPRCAVSLATSVSEQAYEFTLALADRLGVSHAEVIRLCLQIGAEEINGAQTHARETARG